jgi:hypothetical protein
LGSRVDSSEICLGGIYGIAWSGIRTRIVVIRASAGIGSAGIGSAGIGSAGIGSAGAGIIAARVLGVEDASVE